MIPDELRDAVNAAVPGGVTHIGFVAANCYGEFLVTEPKGQPYGVVATFNKTKVQPGEQSFDTLLRCLREQIGAPTTGVFPIRTTWVTSNSVAFYFAGMLWNASVPSPNFNPHYKAWCNYDAARNHISRSTNAESKRRDLALLDAASQMCLSPFRRILLMVRQLHGMGFERLRAPAYEYPLAWRCPIVPAYWTLQAHGGRFDDPSLQLEQLFGIKHHKHCYSAASGQFPFGWQDLPFAGPKELAEMFVRRQPEIALAGWGPDTAYLRWFDAMLDATAPHGLISAFSEDKSPNDYLYTLMTRVERIPLPPPGWAREGEFQHHFHDKSD